MFFAYFKVSDQHKITLIPNKLKRFVNITPAIVLGIRGVAKNRFYSYLLRESNVLNFKNRISCYKIIHLKPYRCLRSPSKIYFRPKNLIKWSVCLSAISIIAYNRSVEAPRTALFEINPTLIGMILLDNIKLLNNDFLLKNLFL